MFFSYLSNLIDNSAELILFVRYVLLFHLHIFLFRLHGKRIEILHILWRTRLCYDINLKNKHKKDGWYNFFVHVNMEKLRSFFVFTEFSGARWIDMLYEMFAQCEHNMYAICIVEKVCIVHLLASNQKESWNVL